MILFGVKLARGQPNLFSLPRRRLGMSNLTQKLGIKDRGAYVENVTRRGSIASGKNDAKIFSFGPCHNRPDNYCRQSGRTRIRRQWQHRQNTNTHGRLYHQRMIQIDGCRANAIMRGRPFPLQRGHCTPRSAIRIDASGSRGFTRKSKSTTVPQLSQLIISQ
jgi:hypothetical protein